MTPDQELLSTPIPVGCVWDGSVLYTATFTRSRTVANLTLVAEPPLADYRHRLKAERARPGWSAIRRGAVSPANRHLPIDSARTE